MMRLRPRRYEHGIATFDTADIYSFGLAEKFLGNAIRRLDLPREELVIMTKIGLPMDDLDAVKKRYTEPERYGLVNRRGLCRKHIFDGVREAPARMQLDYINVCRSQVRYHYAHLGNDACLA
ncbi:transporter [Ganoderma sinense ZZ0214-1]|uniref:Transporter n=1 Tax=Ganoderma sinense ZZ0214-1 TaxID=1077348 RepID=A0A2G8SHN6_9APHY|nr:transporter [Ganoderma sinense ZZ0214-1]